jgi:hypothetical protein
MSQNRSHAVMAQRAEPDDSLDDFPTPPWGTRAAAHHIIVPLAMKHALPVGKVAEPACNRGFMARPLAEIFKDVYASDVHDYGCGYAVDDFLFPCWRAPFGQPDWIITNPPFRLAEQFIDKGLACARTGVAILVRTTFIEGIGRYHSLFSTRPPTVFAQFSERLPMVKGRCDPDASTATAYCWLVWVHGLKPKPTFWIPPCRAQLERAGDYEVAAA